MSYIVFDLDETLAELYPVFYFVASLRPEGNHIIPDDPKKQLLSAYELFIKKVLKQENSNDAPLGVLRPGILSVFEMIEHRHKNGPVKGVVIYSNNGHLESLEFIRDLIHKHLQTTDLILECVHWGHHMREEERGYKQGVASKTWKVLSEILKGPRMGAPDDLSPRSVYFFDDMLHKDLKENLKNNYTQVPSYTFKASFDTLAQLFTESIDEAGVNKEKLLDMVSDTLGTRADTYDKLLVQFKQKTRGTSNEPGSTKEDSGIQLMKQVLRSISRSFKGGRRRWNGKTRKHKQKRNRTYRKK
jgi:hypothetical protein